MVQKKFTMQLRWADVDANQHLRHSVYYDYGAVARMDMLTHYGLTTNVMHQKKMGPILFREEAIFKKEILLEDVLTITTDILKCRSDFSRWSIQHKFVKNGDTLASIINIDGAWIDLVTRRLYYPDEAIKKIMDGLPKSEHFHWEEIK